MEQINIFMSCSEQDHAFSSELASALQQRGANIWYPQSALSVMGIVQEPVRGIFDRPVAVEEQHNRSIHIVLLSPATFTSYETKDEIRRGVILARHQPKRLFLPIEISPVTLPEVEKLGISKDTIYLSVANLSPAEAINRIVQLVVPQFATPPNDASTHGMRNELIAS